MSEEFTKETEPATGLSRRGFLKASAGVAGAWIVGFHWSAKTPEALAKTEGAAAAYPPNAFIQIAPDNSITILINKLEMGQGVNTSLAQLIAEELECDWEKIHSVSAPVNPVYNHTARPTQMAGGSSSVRSSYDQHRTIGAAMREMLIGAAAKKWDVPRGECHAENGAVVHAKKGRLTYGELAEAASRETYPHDVKLKSPKDFKVIGKSVRRVDAKEKSTGKAVFGLDVKIPNMLYVMVARSPVRGGKITSLDDGAAKKVKNVVDVVRFDESVAVLAKNTWAAKQGRDALNVTWDAQGRDTFSHESLANDFRSQFKNAGVEVEKRGDPEKGFKTAVNHWTMEYEFPYLAHACLEPMNCTINYDGKKAEIWAGHQMPTADRDAAAKVLELDPGKVEVHSVYAGGSFGRRANKDCDYAREAAQLAKIVKKPLKIVWTREDDFAGGYYRPLTLHRVALGLNRHGELAGWKHQIVGQSILSGSPMAGGKKMDVDPTVVEGVSGTAYALPQFHVSLQLPSTDVTTLWWRSVGHTHTAYVMETMIDELAHYQKKDPMALRKQLLRSSPRHLAVLNLLEAKSGWGKKRKTGRALGLAIHESFNSVVGHVAEVSYAKGALKIHRIVSAVHCGIPVNPEGAKSQVEGGIIFALSAALYGEMTFDKGRVTTTNFDRYRLVRLHEAPEVEVHLVPSDAPPTGLGEPGVPPTAPAVANAIFKLTGKRLRKLPFTRELKFS
jgi:isoquinoline 1-oxidoreductase beta subunit